MWEVEFTDEFGQWWQKLDADEQASMRKKFKELEDSMTPEQLKRSEARAKEMMAEMVLAELRKYSDLTQEQLAESMGIKQSALSRIESQTDMHISTLFRLIHGLGGTLELIAHLPKGDVRISQFMKKAV